MINALAQMFRAELDPDLQKIVDEADVGSSAYAKDDVLTQAAFVQVVRHLRWSAGCLEDLRQMRIYERDGC